MSPAAMQTATAQIPKTMSAVRRSGACGGVGSDFDIGDVSTATPRRCEIVIILSFRSRLCSCEEMRKRRSRGMAKRNHHLPGLAFVAFALCLTAPGGCKGGNTEEPGGSPMRMELASAAFKEGETIPLPHTADGKNSSPGLRWASAPEGTRSFALICDDPDAPRKTWVHWVIFNIPASS